MIYIFHIYKKFLQWEFLISEIKASWIHRYDNFNRA